MANGATVTRFDDNPGRLVTEQRLKQIKVCHRDAVAFANEWLDAHRNELEYYESVKKTAEGWYFEGADAELYSISNRIFEIFAEYCSLLPTQDLKEAFAEASVKWAINWKLDNWRILQRWRKYEPTIDQILRERGH